MSIWKDLLFLGGYVASPATLEATPDARDAVARPAEPAPAPRPERRKLISSSELLW